MHTKTYISSFRSRTQFILTIVLAPLTISLLADIIIQNVKGIVLPLWQYIITTILIVIFLLLLMAGYTNKLNKLVIILNRHKRLSGLKKPKVLILDGTFGTGDEIPPRPVFTDYAPQEWESSLRQTTNWKVETGALSSLKNFQIVINPFGEVYPEDNASNFSSFHQICDYVFNGGIFVNVAGIPFFYYHDTKDPLFQTKRATAGTLHKELTQDGEVIILRSLFLSKFPQIRDFSDSAVVNCSQSNDDRRLFGEIAGAGGNNQATMFRAYQPKTPGIRPLLYSENPAKWLIISLKYGDGFFLLAGLDLKGIGNTGFHKVIAAIKGWQNYEVQNKN